MAITNNLYLWKYLKAFCTFHSWTEMSKKNYYESLMRKKVKRTRKFWHNELNPAHRRSQAKCKPVTFNKLNCPRLPYNKHLINRA